MGGQSKAFQVFASAPEINLLIGTIENEFQDLNIEVNSKGKKVRLLTNNKENAGLVLYEILNELKTKYWK